ncbi:alpha-L-fucosidase [Parvibaculum lavamentivorans]|uniref:alpha-L-fucosidase n=1 Tax=Parvibaculum lavamentivorans TaxID=256618 RepID=UPI0000ED47A7|nr:alpha-L-fucosidase [Parvibaculum lavamentivorans]
MVCDRDQGARTPSAEFHAEHYGNRPYGDFREAFAAGLKSWDPDSWAEAFARSGAKYFVLVTKHHDGFCLWPSGVANRHEQGWTTERDIVGELARAVRAQGLRFGVYYSGGIDWTFNREPLRTLVDFLGSMPAGDYPAYALAQTRELIERYEPSVLWNDISWPTGLDELLTLFADYYNAVPEGVVNDRWPHARFASRLLRQKPVRRLVDYFAKRYIAKNPQAVEGIIPQPIPHSDFRTPEYTRFSTIQKKKWEATRGMSYSFGFNRDDKDEDYEAADTLLGDFIDGVSKGGNLLLNIGPRGADAGIPEAQLSRLSAFGDWLGANGSAVYGSKPWGKAGETSDTETADGLPVRFTQRDGMVNILILGRPAGESLRLRNVALTGEGKLLADGSPVGQDLLLTFRRPLDGGFGPVVRVAAV